MRRTSVTVMATTALVATLLTPIARAAPAPSETPGPPSSGSDCAWGTEPAGQIPAVAYDRSYTSGSAWMRANPSPYDCALGPSWLPFTRDHPVSHVYVLSSESHAYQSTMHLCASLGDPTCSPDSWGMAMSVAAFGYCATEEDFNCVESLAVIAPDGTSTQARYVRGFPDTPAVPEFREGNTYAPAGGSVPLWEFTTPDGPVTIATAGFTEKNFLPQGGEWTTRPGALLKFSLRPVVIEPRAGVVKPLPVEEVNPQTGKTQVHLERSPHGVDLDCYAVDAGECAIEVGFPEGYRYRVSLRLRDETSLYLNGAVGEPVAYSEKLKGGHRFVLEGGPSPVLGVAGWIPKAMVPTDLIDATFASLGGNRAWDMTSQGVSAQALGRGGPESLPWFKALLPFLGDRASFITDAWYVENTPTQGRYTNQCISQGRGEFIGIVASNATAYTGDPPTYDASTSTLRYEVAGPHYMPDGTTLSKGRYSINMNANFVKCILGVDRVPSVARVELIYPDGEASVATLALKQDKNWLRLVYENFTFSNPTVSVKFPTSLTCFKGKGKKVQSKKFVAFECPTGWRPKR